MFFLIIIFLIITLTGFVIVRTITKEVDSFILLPVSQIVGVTFYIFLLNLISKIFHGQTGIIISSLGLIFFTIFLFIRYKSTWVKLNPLSTNSKFLAFITICIIFTLSVVKMFTILPAADSSMQWAYAASFARGNHPLMTPWQSDLTPNYHLGAYFLEGALVSLTGATFILIHTIFNVFLLLAGSLIIIFFLWKRGGYLIKLWAIPSVLIFFVAYGVIVTTFPDFISSHSQLIELSKLREAIPAKGEAEAALVNLDSLSYLPARSLSIGLILLALFFINTPFKNSALKILSFSILLAVSALVEESMFIPFMLSVVSIFILSFFPFIPRLGYIANQRKILLIILILTTVMVIFQGGFITDNIFGAKRETTAYRILNPLSSQIFYRRLRIFNDVYFKSNLPIPFSGWLIPSPIWFLLILLIYSYIKKDPTGGSIALFAAVAFALFLTTEYHYCSGCSIRLHSFGYIALGFGILYIIINLLKKTSKKKNLIILSIFIILVLIPTITSDVIYQTEVIKRGLRQNKPTIILSHLNSTQEDMYRWAEENIPLNERIIVLDIEFPSPGGTLGFQYHGLYTILGPQYIRVNRQEPGAEFYDLALTLNPSLLAKTKTHYIYIESESAAYKQLPDIRKQELENSSFFQVLKYTRDNNNSYMLLKALPLFFDEKSGGKEINEGRIDQLVSLIPKNASIYLSDYGESDKFLNFWYRLPFAYILGDGSYNLVMNMSQTTYQVIETIMNRRFPRDGELYDYYILPPTQKPDVEAELIWSNILASAWKRI